MLNLNEFLAYGEEGYNLVPVWKNIKKTQISPISIYEALANKSYSYLFELSEKHEDKYRATYSIVGLPCHQRIEIKDYSIKVFDENNAPTYITDIPPLDALRQILASYRVPKIDQLPNYAGGLFGYFGFETTRLIEPKLQANTRKKTLIDLPDILQIVSQELIVVDHRNDLIYVIVHAKPTESQNFADANLRINQIISELEKIPYQQQANFSPSTTTDRTTWFKDMESHFPQHDFQMAVNKIKEYIKAGDAMQVVLSQAMSRPLKANAIQLYQALTSMTNTPYCYLMNVEDSHVVGASPEMMVSLHQNKLISHPMAGTRHRGMNQQEDDALKAELLADNKEIAEHIMLVDLARNDIGRVAKTGSVTVNNLLSVEYFSHVMHIVSEVSGEKMDGIDEIDVISSTFPAGTLSGAPKIRALEIIHELEPYGRGVYGGCLGYITWNGDINLAITIRTGLLHQGQLYVQAGAGIIDASRAEREWQETIEKNSMMMHAAYQAEQFSL
ncbi:anthranilate synthase component I family protein [Xenorhabdus bovienii]|uniref:Anthranilate synthase component 1 n=1 Tax=Xenorhabdus bovienii str. kraussei Becker Underwood TaxID=1398204 RepID=A0A077Q3I9_XENBV|nr:chorismate-binding protein [Xenorhabdus bovienii]MCG3471128.1 chorismate-binding protein [Xenorhabdus bovienii]MDE1488410.1 chorismate-binding protein [Xenorhabdus bovienii]MDE9432200.1 chorismate-binding protein [Xenorhabdus bovienii]MDE9441097.1 chorismate-binding protein [Xenorhabdus bovienii]MDE9461254.1 chorismate-binding protein [Xenorhabdus bovienii]